MPKNEKRNSILSWLLPAMLIGFLSAGLIRLLMLLVATFAVISDPAWGVSTPHASLAEIDGAAVRGALAAIRGSDLQGAIDGTTVYATVVTLACATASASIAHCVAARRRGHYRNRTAAQPFQPPVMPPFAAPSAPIADDDEAQYRAVLMTMPYERKNLLTKEERRFWQVLLEALRGRGAIITVKPSLKEFIQVPGYGQGEVNQRAWREIAQKHVDFLICEEGTMRPLFAIEYDGDTHSKIDASNAATIRSDEFKDRLFARLGIPLIRVPYGDWTAESLSRFFP